MEQTWLFSFFSTAISFVLYLGGGVPFLIGVEVTPSIV
jgi:hypothetical protein